MYVECHLGILYSPHLCPPKDCEISIQDGIIFGKHLGLVGELTKGCRLRQILSLDLHSQDRDNGITYYCDVAIILIW
jgi:hypothetical protein